jgi:hypothetical protein
MRSVRSGLASAIECTVMTSAMPFSVSLVRVAMSVPARLRISVE